MAKPTFPIYASDELKDTIQDFCKQSNGKYVLISQEEKLIRKAGQTLQVFTIECQEELAIEQHESLSPEFPVFHFKKENTNDENNVDKEEAKRVTELAETTYREGRAAAQKYLLNNEEVYLTKQGGFITEAQANAAFKNTYENKTTWFGTRTQPKNQDSIALRNQINPEKTVQENTKLDGHDDHGLEIETDNVDVRPSVLAHDTHPLRTYIKDKYNPGVFGGTATQQAISKTFHPDFIKHVKAGPNT